jgi:pimeloyl-ACP methyl ester carboxylesterase
VSGDGTPSLPGTVDSFGGRDVHWVHQAGSRPPVVLLGGCGVPYYVWDPVVAGLPAVELARLDRPGVGGTRWPGVLPTLAAEVATLADLIGRLDSPAVVVGHSMAGLHAEALARTHPELVSGLVLVDSSVEWKRKAPGPEALWLAAARATRAAMALRPLRPLGSLADRVLTARQSNQRSLLGPASDLAREVFRDPEAAASVIAEQAAYGRQVQDLARLRETRPFPQVEVVVLTATGDGGAQWAEDQRRLADLLGGQQVVVPESRHLMMIDQPDLVVEAVRSLRTPTAKPRGAPDV